MYPSIESPNLTAAYVEYLLPIETKEGKAKFNSEAATLVVERLMNQAQLMYTSKILILHTFCSASALKILTQSGSNTPTQIFEEPDLLYNPLEHILSPRYEVIPSDQESKLLERMGLTKDKLPEALDNDPSIKFLGCQIGQIVKITRKQIFLPVLASKSVIFRVVIRGPKQELKLGRKIEKTTVKKGKNRKTEKKEKKKPN